MRRIGTESIWNEDTSLQSLKGNGILSNNVFLPNTEIARGGKPGFTMRPQPNKRWGANDESPRTK